MVGFSQQLSENVYIDFENPKSILQLESQRNLKTVKSVHFDNIDNLKVFEAQLLKIKDVVEIDRVIITNYPFKKLTHVFSELEFISKVTFIHCDELNLKQTLKLLAELPILEELNLGNNKIEILPKEIALLTHLNALNISFNKSIDLKQSIEHLKGCPSLQKLALPVNELSELPANISKLKQLRELNLMNNNLTDLPIELADMDSLEVLYLAKNIFVDPIKTYSKFEKLNIKILSIDEVSESELERIQNFFPNTKVNQERQEDIEVLEKHTASAVQEQKKESYTVVQKREAYDVEVHSLAYTRYSATFDVLQKPLKVIDSTLFDERFLDTNYYNIFRRQKGLDYDFFELKLSNKAIKNQLWIAFDISTYFYNNFEEQKAFTSMVWAVVGNESSKSDFKKEYIKGIKYTDYRLFYRSDLKNFVLRLKTTSGFKELVVVPRFENKKGSISTVQSSYEIRYVRYLEHLDRRRSAFNKKQYDKTVSYRLKVNKLHSKAWEDFKKKYFSDVEKQMNEKDWLIYYDKVLSDEKSALRNTLVEAHYIQRYIDLLEYREAKNIEDVKKYKDTQVSRFQFRDNQGKDVAITSLIVLNKTLGHYRVYDGSKGLMEFYLFLRQSDEYVVFGMFRNGDIGIAPKLDFDNIFFRQEESNLITLKRFKKDFSDVGDMIKYAKLL